MPDQQFLMFRKFVAAFEKCTTKQMLANQYQVARASLPNLPERLVNKLNAAADARALAIEAEYTVNDALNEISNQS